MRIGKYDINLSQVIVVLAVLVDIQGAIGSGKVSLNHMVPASWIDVIVAWNVFLAFVGTTIMGVLAVPGAFGNRSVPVIPPAAKSMIILAVVLGSAFAFAGDAKAQMTPRAHQNPPVSAESVPAPAPAPGLPELHSYLPKPHLLKIPNPLGLPDPMCITDHPGGNCPAGTELGGGVKMSGNPKQDLADFFKRGGITLVRDMLRSDQFFSYPCTASTTNCTKTDQLSSACVEAIVPIAKLIVNGPPSVGTDATTALSTPSPPATEVLTAAAAPGPMAATTPSDAPSPKPSPSPSPLMLNGLPAVNGPNGKPISTDSPAISSSDDGVVTAAAKLDIVLIALNGPALKQGCAGWVQDKFTQGTDLAAGVMTFVTTLGLAGA